MDQLTELNELELHDLTSIEVGRVAILFTTPLCGTCKVAEKMLSISAHVGVPCKLYKANINYMPYFREHWKISSVPALVLMKNGGHVDTIYAMQAVDAIVNKLNTF